jgi:hypothetical protein
MKRSTRTAVVAASVAVCLGASATTILAASLEPDGVHLRADWANGGGAQLELEDRNLEPVICFIWENDRPQDGDSIASRILTRAGAEVVDLGVGDQWVDGSASGCEIPHDDRYRDVFADPGQYVVEFRVVEEQGTPATSPNRSGPLQHGATSG